MGFKMVLLNAFSANMLADFPVTVTFTEITATEARAALMCAAEADGEADCIRSAVGHADTAAVFESVLNTPVPCRRETVLLRPGDSAIVGQYHGARLPEGATLLPQGATIKWLVVEVS